MNLMSVKYIIWDWNGTLFNDVDICLKCMNMLLTKYMMPVLSRMEYRQKFCFPVKEFYRNAGFDFAVNNFADLAHEFMFFYEVEDKHCSLTDGAVALIEELHVGSYKQVVLSASKKDTLIRQAEKFHIRKYIDHIWGIDNIYAETKADLAVMFMKSLNIKPSEAVFIGDTFHDYEVSKAIGSDCIIYLNGHQQIDAKNIEALQTVRSLAEIRNLIKSHKENCLKGDY